MWIICDQGHAINLDHFTRLDWKKCHVDKVDDYYQVVAVRDFRHLGMVQRWDDEAKAAVPDVAVQTFRICNRMTEEDARVTVEHMITEHGTTGDPTWIASEHEAFQKHD